MRARAASSKLVGVPHPLRERVNGHLGPGGARASVRRDLWRKGYGAAGCNGESPFRGLQLPEPVLSRAHEVLGATENPCSGDCNHTAPST